MNTGEGYKSLFSKAELKEAICASLSTTERLPRVTRLVAESDSERPVGVIPAMLIDMMNFHTFKEEQLWLGLF